MQIKITKEGETKNFHIFKKEGISHTYDVDKMALARALIELETWQNNPGATNFTSILYNLMAKADKENQEKLFNGFPVRTTAYILWFNSTDKKELYDTYVKGKK